VIVEEIDIYGAVAALADDLTDHYGGALAAAASGYFEQTYGCDPCTFLRHVILYGSLHTNCQTPWTVGASILT
jgi:hypothetical protein